MYRTYKQNTFQNDYSSNGYHPIDSNLKIFINFIIHINEAANFVVNATATAYDQLLTGNFASQRSIEIMPTTEPGLYVKMTPEYEYEKTVVVN